MQHECWTRFPIAAAQVLNVLDLWQMKIEWIFYDFMENNFLSTQYVIQLFRFVSVSLLFYTYWKLQFYLSDKILIVYFFYIRMLHAKFAAAVKWLRRNFNWCSFSQVIKAVEKGKLFVCQHDDFITKSCTMNELILSFGFPWRMSNFNMAVK